MVLPLRIRKSVMLIGDVLLMYLSLVLTIIVRNMGLDETLHIENHIPPFTVVFLIWVINFYVSGLYDLHQKQSPPLREAATVLTTFIVSTFLSVAVFYIIRSFYITPKTVLVLFGVIYFCLFLSWRWVFRMLLVKRVGRLRVAFVGWDESLVELVSDSDTLNRVGCEPIFVFDESTASPRELSAIPQLTTIRELAESFEHLKIDVVVTSIDLRSSDALERILFQHLNESTSYYSLPLFFEWVTRRIPVNAINRFWFLDQLDLRGKTAYRHTKRLIDIVFSLAMMTATLPIWPIIWLLVRLESPGPGFFSQPRCGIQDKVFTIYKFRTMRTENNTQDITQPKDKRITRVGGFLRRTRLDELPQLINILKGEMSFVGPRPERPEIVRDLEKEVPFYRQRNLVIPGLTGWDQVSGEYHSATAQDSLKKLQHDLYYIKNRSLILDVSILLKTIAIVLSRRGR